MPLFGRHLKSLESHLQRDRELINNPDAMKALAELDQELGGDLAKNMLEDYNAPDKTFKEQWKIRIVAVDNITGRLA